MEEKTLKERVEFLEKSVEDIRAACFCIVEANHIVGIQLKELIIEIQNIKDNQYTSFN